MPVGPRREVGGAVVFGATKNHQRRTVALPRFLTEELAAYLSAMGRADDPEALVFTSERGDVSRQSNFYPRIFKPAVLEAGIDPELRFHDLRHTCAALLIAQGAHPRAMMERLGHSSVTVTLDTYAHLFPSLDEQFTAGLEARHQEAVTAAAEADARYTRDGADVIAFAAGFKT